MKHSIQIDVNHEPVLSVKSMSIPKKIFKAIFGDPVNILVLKPGEQLAAIKVHEVKDGEAV